MLRKIALWFSILACILVGFMALIVFAESLDKAKTIKRIVSENINDLMHLKKTIYQNGDSLEQHIYRKTGLLQMESYHLPTGTPLWCKDYYPDGETVQFHTYEDMFYNVIIDEYDSDGVIVRRITSNDRY